MMMTIVILGWSAKLVRQTQSAFSDSKIWLVIVCMQMIRINAMGKDV